MLAIFLGVLEPCSASAKYQSIFHNSGAFVKSKMIWRLDDSDWVDSRLRAGQQVDFSCKPWGKPPGQLSSGLI